MSQTTARDMFAGNSRKYYEVFLHRLDISHAGGLLFAWYEGQVIAAGIFVYSGYQAIYYYGASVSDPALRKHMAPYLIQWEAMLEAKRRSSHTYDMLGIADPRDTHSHLR